MESQIVNQSHKGWVIKPNTGLKGRGQFPDGSEQENLGCSKKNTSVQAEGSPVTVHKPSPSVQITVAIGSKVAEGPKH